MPPCLEGMVYLKDNAEQNEAFRLQISKILMHIYFKDTSHAFDFSATAPVLLKLHAYINALLNQG